LRDPGQGWRGKPDMGEWEMSAWDLASGMDHDTVIRALKELNTGKGLHHEEW